ncbi:MAG: sulfatase, partial [Lentisphaerae bacterium]|nr:sulfatase [Lentisphaerota bacterium]
MHRHNLITLTCLTAAIVLALPHVLPAAPVPAPPNILFITVDDMNCDSIGAFGCKLPGTSPNVDRLASEGIRFAHAHVQVANCVPSRNVMQTGRYPHNSGVEGFYQVKAEFPILPDVLKQHGYFTAIKGKVSHSTPFHPYSWDLVLTPENGRKLDRNRDAFAALTRQAIGASKEAGKPFYLLMNITDPHKPFYGMGRNGQPVEDLNVPSRVYSPDEVPVPGFLPDLPVVRKELAHYYSSVRRADDCVGAILAELKEAGHESNTVVMFLSDHGMPFPFAKTSLYHHSTHTPWIVRWPGVTRASAIDSRHMISAVDFMPTILDIVDVPVPVGLDGRSFLPLLKEKTQNGRDMVFKEYNENAGAGRNPMRSVVTQKHGYIFNPWANGERKFKTATTGTLTYKAM